MRVERGPSRDRREVFACARYLVAFEPDGTARATLVGASDGSGGQLAEPLVVDVKLGDECFVMNDVGQTVDAIRARRPAQAAAGGR